MMKTFIFLVVVMTFQSVSTKGTLQAEIHDHMKRIVGGSPTTSGQFPWQLLLKKGGSGVCGAVLISGNRALTAAHCLNTLLPYSAYSVDAGEHNKDVRSGNEWTEPVSSWTIHPSYSSTGAGYPNDIAILSFAQSFPNNSYIHPITMATSTASDYAGVTCTISGWGKLADGSRPSILQSVNMPAITNAYCALGWQYVTGTSINAGHICVYQRYKSSCIGDSGGPLVCDGVLAGTSSFGNNRCSPRYPSVYSRISYFRDWIDSNM